MEAWRSALPPLEEENWQQVLAAHDVAVVFFWAEWSPYDLAMRPVLREVRPEFSSVAFFSCDMTDGRDAVAEALDVWSNPLLICFFSGQRHDTSVGYLNLRQLRAKLREWLAAST